MLARVLPSHSPTRRFSASREPSLRSMRNFRLPSSALWWRGLVPFHCLRVVWTISRRSERFKWRWTFGLAVVSCVRRKCWSCAWIHEKRSEIFIPKRQAVNALFYLDVMKRLLMRIRRVRPEYREKGTSRLLHDNAAPAHQSTWVTNFFTKMAFWLSTIFRLHLVCLRAISVCSESCVWPWEESVMQTLKTFKGWRLPSWR